MNGVYVQTGMRLSAVAKLQCAQVESPKHIAPDPNTAVYRHLRVDTAHRSVHSRTRSAPRVETVTDQFDTVYDTLIAQVERYHGSLVSVEGDAITCWPTTT